MRGSLKGDSAAGDEGDHEIVPVPVPTLAAILPEDEIYCSSRRRRAAIAFAPRKRYCWGLAYFLPLISCLVDISVGKSVPISCLAGEVMAAGIGVGSGGRIRVI